VLPLFHRKRSLSTADRSPDVANLLEGGIRFECCRCSAENDLCQWLIAAQTWLTYLKEASSLSAAACSTENDLCQQLIAAQISLTNLKEASSLSATAVPQKTIFVNG
jgi:hypothetical protein